jgi:hypothetical protein
MLTKSEALQLLSEHIEFDADTTLHPHTISAELFKEMLFETYAYEKGDLENPPALLLYAVIYLSHQKYNLKEVDFNAYIKQTTFLVDFEKYRDEIKNVNRLRYYSVQLPLEIARHISAQKKKMNYCVNPRLLESIYMTSAS